MFSESMQSRLIFLLLAVMPCFAIAQQSHFLFRKVTINEGLSQSSVVDITTDSTGFMWFATQDGLNRFDGKEMIVYRKTFDDITTPTHSQLGKLVCAENNTMWLLSNGGKLETFNFVTQRFKAVHRIGKDSMWLPPVNCIYTDKTYLLLGTSKGLYIYHHRTNQIQLLTIESTLGQHLHSNNIQAIYKDTDQQYWLLTDNGVAVMNTAGKLIESFLYKSSSDTGTWISCSAIAEDKEGNYWLGTYGKGIYLRIKNGSSFVPFTKFENRHIPSNTVTEAMLADDDGNVWIGTYGNGLFVINSPHRSLQHYKADYRNPLSLSYNDILSIKKDKFGGIWLGTDGGGVNHYDKRYNNFELLNQSNVPDDIAIEQVRSITTDSSGGLWIGTSNNGLTYTDAMHDSFVTFHFKPYQSNLSNYDRIASLLCDKEKDIWVGTQGNGLIILEEQSKKIKNRFYPGATGGKALPDHTIWCMLPQNDTQVWIGTRNAGLCLVDKYKGIVKNLSAFAENGRSPARK